jgi:hypothetical protein
VSFPPRPETDDERRTKLLELMEVPRSPRLYVLGCFARYVTVYAQQIRAFNLVDALAKNGVLTARSEIAVIGGGIAGLTAAAAAAVRGAARAVVYEKLENTMRIQRATEKRFIHPHIYDWPAARALKGLDDEAPAGHDVMDWTADRADAVVAELDQQWTKIRDRYSAAEEPRFNCHPIEIEPRGARWAVQGEEFDLVILAVGFGRDGEVFGTESYWTDTSLDGLEMERGGTWLVSGYGDGGLTELMRLCISDFRHRAVLELIDGATREKVGHTLREADRAGTTPERLADFFQKAARTVASDLDAGLRKRAAVGRVVLNCPTKADLFSGSSSVLNRLIAAYLLHDRRFELLPQGGLIKTLEPTAEGRYAITFADQTAPPFEADHVVVRHGPKSALEIGFRHILEQCEKLREIWASARQHDDWTREPLYSPGAFAGDGETRLRADFGEKVGCVVISSSAPFSGPTHATRVAAALTRLQKRPGRHDRDIDTTPVQISAVDALSSPALYEWTVRALCDSEIAVFDITDFESAVMLFLGLRAAVRRGVTLTMYLPREPGEPRKPGEQLPFNLAALSPIPWGRDDRKRIADAMATGLEGLRMQEGAYLDLPVFDAVRQLGEEYRPIPLREQVLVLRWFDEGYGAMVRDVIKDILLDAGLDEQTQVVTTLDSSSPQLVSQRLYALIRRVQLCVADWTGWRANVFFEIGVRLAVSPDDPVFTICHEKKWTTRDDRSGKALRDFFNPIEFDFTQGYGGAAHEVSQLFSEPHGRGRLSPGRTYEVVSEAIPRDLEPGGRSLHEELIDEARRIAGPPGPEDGNFPLLYSKVLAPQARMHAVEMLIAAWHYLDRRHAVTGRGLIERVRTGELTANDATVTALRSVGQELSGRLRDVPGPEYRSIARELRATLAALGDDVHG